MFEGVSSLWKREPITQDDLTSTKERKSLSHFCESVQSFGTAIFTNYVVILFYQNGLALFAVWVSDLSHSPDTEYPFMHLAGF